MARPRTYEQQLLAKAESLLNAAAREMTERLSIIEMVAAKHSGANIQDYWESQHVDAISIDNRLVDSILFEIKESGIPIPYAIAALAREPLTVEEQKKNGVFYTDFRLASFLAEDCKPWLKKDSDVADLAVGTGILLAGIALLYIKQFPLEFDKWITEHLYAYDLSEYAVRGAAAVMLSLTQNTQAITKMKARWKCCDSLLDEALDGQLFDIVVGNPPWGKLKLSRHAYLTRQGIQRVYGTSYTDLDNSFVEEKIELKEYSNLIREKYHLLGTAEPDMYMAFLQKATNTIRAGGHVSYLVPAGLIRSQGTKDLREYFVEHGDFLNFTLLDNKSNYFAIDTRFKFLLFSYNKGSISGGMNEFGFNIAGYEKQTLNIGEHISFYVDELRECRPDLTVPEVKTQKEKELLFKLYHHGREWGEYDDIWFADISREVDMTNDRTKFSQINREGSLAVIEGRMVQQYRFGAKAYISGSGRSAKWEPNATGCKPQFYCDSDKLPVATQERVKKLRVGFCDIAGQTNERAMMSSIIPAGVVCGNKVPTIIFPNAENDDIYYLWMAITNSFVFDWMIRRIITTTINYFLLFSVPIPQINFESDDVKQLVHLSRKIYTMGSDYYTSFEMSEARARTEAIVAYLYGLTREELELIFMDFPLLDRGQPRLKNQKKSSVTEDFCIGTFVELQGKEDALLKQRILDEKNQMAHPFIPSEMISLCEM